MRVLNADVVEGLGQLPDGSVHCCVTSPPYWGLRDYGVPGQLGLEPVPDCLGWATGSRCGGCYICRMTAVFREVWRVLRDDGTVWCNCGDSFTSGGRIGHGTRQGYKQQTNRGMNGINDPVRPGQPSGLKPKDLIGIPWRLAFSLQADGWYLRSDIIWHKPNPMPESVTDRPTKAHEYLFLLTKQQRYYYDAEAIREPVKPGNKGDVRCPTLGSHRPTDPRRMAERQYDEIKGANRRSVWTVSTSPYPEAHFATFPPKLVEPCIKAGTSERGCCPSCGAPWERVVERKSIVTTNGRGGNPSSMRKGDNADASLALSGKGGVYSHSKTTGWRPTCDHGGDPVPCTVLDPFAGSGTTGEVAVRLGREAVLIELSADYCQLIEQRLSRVVRQEELFQGVA